MTTSAETSERAVDLPGARDHGPSLAAAPARSPAAFLKRLVESTPRGGALALLVLRAGFGAALAFGHGLSKLNAPAAFVQGLAKRDFPAPIFFGWAALLSEFVGGLLLALGLLTRPAATLVLITMTVAALDIHAGAPFAKRELALAYATVALALLLAGPGRYSLDWRWFSAKSTSGRRGSDPV